MPEETVTPMRRVLRWIRDRWHPLHALRQSRRFGKLLKALDRPISCRIPHIAFPVQVMALRNANISISAANPHINLFLVMADVFQVKTFWDVGANIGYYTWVLKSSVPALDAVMFEPDTINKKLIGATIRKNRLPSIELRPAAVGSARGSTTFKVDSFGSETGSIARAETIDETLYGASSESITVDVIPLDEVLQERNGQLPDLVKIDVEGAEQLAFEGATNLVKSEHPVFHCEVRNEFKEYIFGLLQSAGYRVLDASNLSELSKSTWDILAIPRRLQGKEQELRARFLKE